MLMSQRYGYNSFDLTNYNYICWGIRFSSNQTSTSLLTTILILWLDYYLKERISNLDNLLKSNCYFSVCTSHNGPQHKVYNMKDTSSY